VLDVEYPVAIVLLALVALLYTGIGGLRGVIWVDAIQMFVYIGGAIAAAVLLVAGRMADGIQSRAPPLTPGSSTSSTSERRVGFLADCVYAPRRAHRRALLSMASHGTDQLIVQRVLATRSVTSGRKALIGSGVIIVLQFALFLVVGLLLYGHYGGRSVAELGLRRSDEIFPMFIVEGLPPGLSGFIIAGLLAAALSTLAGSMSSMASSSVLDIYRSFRRTPVGPERELRLSRVVTALWATMLVFSALFFMNTNQTVVELALGIASFTYGGLLGTFLLGVMFRAPREPHALVAFAGGILAMVAVITLGLVAWTWYTPVGAAVTIAIGLLAARVRRAGRGVD